MTPAVVHKNTIWGNVKDVTDVVLIGFMSAETSEQTLALGKHPSPRQVGSEAFFKHCFNPHLSLDISKII